MNGVHCGLVMNGGLVMDWWSSTKSIKWLYLYALVFCVIINSIEVCIECMCTQAILNWLFPWEPSFQGVDDSIQHSQKYLTAFVDFGDKEQHMKILQQELEREK